MSEQTNQTKMSRVIGYIRVSTREQEQKGISLDAQSAYNQHSSKRPGLREVLSRATSEGLPILVVSIDRLSRSMKDLSLPEFSALEIISVKEGKVGPRKLRKLVKAAEATSANAARLAKEMIRSGIKKGRKRGNKTNLRDAQRSGAINNMLMR
jgi:hypothetical protein